ncbi:MAG: hypothetical protein DRG09_06625 [Epsilonproteobacteria bacterium]|nr:MAG: hypothetical protein DRG09_06625 [Campylobacterota bacterium]
MSKLHYVGPRVEISHQGIVYKKSKEDKYVYLGVALEVLKDIDNNYAEKPSYSHHFENITLEEENLHTTLIQYENKFEECITEECKKYKEKIDHQIAHVHTLPHLSYVDKEVWVKNIEIMRKYKMERALNKMYYIHCIQDIVHVIKDKKIKEITAPFNKNFFHVLNTVKGTLITGKPSLDAKVIEEYNNEGNMIVKLTIRN